VGYPIKYVDIIGPAFLDKYYRKKEGEADQYFPMDLEKEMTWEKIFETFPDIERNLTDILRRKATAMISDPDPSSSGFSTRYNRLAEEFGLDKMKTPRKPRAQKDDAATPLSGPSSQTKQDLRRHK
jgi:hypothetical protein